MLDVLVCVYIYWLCKKIDEFYVVDLFGGEWLYILKGEYWFVFVDYVLDMLDVEIVFDLIVIFWYVWCDCVIRCNVVLVVVVLLMFNVVVWVVVM